MLRIIAFITVILLITTTANAETCYDIGVRFGRCAALSLQNKNCNAEDDIVIPVHCREKTDTQQGIQKGMESVVNTMDQSKSQKTDGCAAKTVVELERMFTGKTKSYVESICGSPAKTLTVESRTAYVYGTTGGTDDKAFVFNRDGSIYVITFY